MPRAHASPHVPLPAFFVGPPRTLEAKGLAARGLASWNRASFDHRIADALRAE